MACQGSSEADPSRIKWSQALAHGMHTHCRRIIVPAGVRRGMTLRNTEFRITFSSKTGRFHYYFAKDAGGWYQVSGAGRWRR